jgi:hypothetical protein
LVDQIAAKLVEDKQINVAHAKEILEELRKWNYDWHCWLWFLCSALQD